MKKQYLQPLPNSVPEGTKAGDEFDLVCTFKLESDGRVCLTAMGDVKAQDDHEKKPSGEKSKYRPDFSDYAGSIQSAGDSATYGGA